MDLKEGVYMVVKAMVNDKWISKNVESNKGIWQWEKLKCQTLKRYGRQTDV